MERDDRVLVRGRYPGVVTSGEVDGVVYVRLDQGTGANYPIGDVVSCWDHVLDSRPWDAEPWCRRCGLSASGVRIADPAPLPPWRS